MKTSGPAKKKSGDISTDKEFNGSFAVSIVNYDAPSLSIASSSFRRRWIVFPFFRVVSLSRSVRRAYKLWRLMLRLRNCMDLRHVSRARSSWTSWEIFLWYVTETMLGAIDAPCPRKLRSSVTVELPLQQYHDRKERFIKLPKLNWWCRVK